MKSSQALMILCLTTALATTGCADTLRQDSDNTTPSASSIATTGPAASQNATSTPPVVKENVASPMEAATASAEGLIDVRPVKKLLRSAVGEDASIRTPEMIQAEPARSRDGEYMAKYGQDCVDATAAYLTFDNAPGVELMTALVSEDSSINQIEAPLTEVVSIRAFASEEDLDQSDELNEKALAACTDDSSRWEQSHTEHDGLPMTVTSQVQIMDSSFFEDSVIVQNLAVNHGSMRVQYSTTPGAFAEAPLSTEEFLAEAGPRIVKIVNGL